MIRYRATVLFAAALAGCTSDSSVPTTPTWTEVTAQQAVAPPPAEIDPYATSRERPPQMKNGCSTAVERANGILVIRHVHQQEIYCVGIAPLRMTTIMLPAGTAVTSTQSAMTEFVQISNADAGGRTIVTLQAKCTPVVKDENGQIKDTELRPFLPQSKLPFCPRGSSDFLVTTTAGIIQFALFFNESSRTRVVDIRSEPTRQPPRPKIPVKGRDAQELYARPVGDVPLREFPWMPDDAWTDGWQTVIVWHRPMPTLPSLHAGEGGEQVAQPPAVIRDRRAIAMVIPRRLDLFELRLDSRRLAFSPEPPEPARATLF